MNNSIAQNIFPWQIKQWQYLVTRLQNDNMPHALCLTGPQHMGKRSFAEKLAQAILCENLTDFACQTCRSCQWVLARTHPDFIIIEPEGEGKNIKVDQIRELVETLSKTSLQGRAQVVIIDSAEAMNISAANALLKTLEEPMGRCIFMLINHQLFSVPATIRSRCQRIAFPVPGVEVTTQWLQDHHISQNLAMVLAFSENIPLKALFLAEEKNFNERQTLLDKFLQFCLHKSNPLKLAEEYADTNINILLDLLWTVLMDMVRIQFNLQTTFCSQNYLEQLVTISAKQSVVALYKTLDVLTDAKKNVARSINLNKQLLLESIFVQLSNIQ